MNKSIFKSVVGGIILANIIFFTGPLIFIVLLLKFIFTPFGMGRMGRGRHPMNKNFMDKIRSMNDNEFQEFKNNMNPCFKTCTK